MAKFVFTYSGGGEISASQAERDARMAAWMGWFGRMGEAVADPGNPFAGAATVTAAGVSAGAASGVNGYTVVQAADLAAATELAKGCPILQAPNGAVEVHEALDM